MLYVARNVHCCRASLRNYEGVVNDDVLRAEILRSVHAAIRLLERRVSGVDRIIGTLESLLTATPVLHSQRAVSYYVEGVAWMVMPGEHFTRFYG